jgi:hypothetical protein
MAIVVTKLIGSGVVSNGYLIAKPWRPWVVWEGEATRPTAKRFKIEENALQELDGSTPAVIPPSYIPSGSSGQVPVIYPDNNYYQVEIIHLGRQIMKGFWKIPYDSTDTGIPWYNITKTIEDYSYTYDGRYSLDAVKTYASISAAEADADNILPGTLIYIADQQEYYGKNETGLISWESSGTATYAYPYASTGLIGFQDTDTGPRFLQTGGYLYPATGEGTGIGEVTPGGYILIVEEP